MIDIILTGAPMAKQRARLSTQTNHVYTPERTVAYESRLANEAQRVMAGRPLLDGALEVDIVAVMPIARSWARKKQDAARSGELLPTKKPDYDNFAKIFDALNLVVWADDSQITVGRVQKLYGDRPLLAIRVTPIIDPRRPPEWLRAHFDMGVFA